MKEDVHAITSHLTNTYFYMLIKYTILESEASEWQFVCILYLKQYVFKNSFV